MQTSRDQARVAEATPDGAGQLSALLTTLDLDAIPPPTLGVTPVVNNTTIASTTVESTKKAAAGFRALHAVNSARRAGTPAPVSVMSEIKRHHRSRRGPTARER